MKRIWPIFLCLSFVLTVLCYREALWGRAMLAPLDIGPAFFTHFRYADPAAGFVPENHHISDQFTYDLPLQAAIHRAYHEGEIPWWDPWTYGGRPLLADAHVNGTDPIRVACYLALPFETAYNWNIALRGILTGLGMFALLRSLRVGPSAAIILALIYQFGGWFTLFFGHPWIQGSLLYFPYLWILWNTAAKSRCGWRDALAAILVALVFISGNLQSHTYLPIFAMAFLAAHLLRSRDQLLSAFRAVALSGIVGALLAAPLLINQLEFFLEGNRAASPDTSGILRLASIPLSLISLHPWAFGSFRTVELGRIVGTPGLAFLLFCGGSITVLAIRGAIDAWKKRDEVAAVRITSLLLLLGYLLVIGTPLSKILYPRMAGLAGMGIIVMAGLLLRDGWQHRPLIPWRWATKMAAIYLIGIIACSAAVWAAYPKIQKKLVEKITAQDVRSSGGLGNLEQRMTQVERLRGEVTLQNPEAVVGLVATLTALLALGMPSADPRQKRLLLSALVLGLLSTWSFHHRFRPKHEIGLWDRMKVGGPAQLDAIEKTRGGLRLDESALPIAEQIFPHAWAVVHRVHVIQGYSALQPRCLLWYPATEPSVSKEWRADWVHEENGQLTRVSDTPSSRFRIAETGMPAPVRILEESHNHLLLQLSSPETGKAILRTDTFYPGWRDQSQNLAPTPEAYAFSRWPTPEKMQDIWKWHYSPPSTRLGPFTLSAGIFALILLVLVGSRRSPKQA